MLGDPYIKRYYCICCEGNELFIDCPLCEDERFFEEECNDAIEDYMRDFYSESIIEVHWDKKTNHEKEKYLDGELTEYFNDID